MHRRFPSLGWILKYANIIVLENNRILKINYKLVYV